MNRDGTMRHPAMRMGSKKKRETFTQRVPASADDGRSHAGGNYNNNANNIIFGDNTGAAFDSWIRYTSVTVPQGVRIISANLELVSTGAETGDDVKLNIYCNDADTAVAPTDEDEHAALDRTTAFTVWDDIPSWSDNEVVTSPDFKSAVQEVIDRAGWASGNALMVLVDDDGSSSGAQRLPDSEDLGEGTEALITIVYEPIGG